MSSHPSTIIGSDASEDANLTCPHGESICAYKDEIFALRREVARLTEQSTTDALTNLYNFRFFNEALITEMERTRRSAQPMALILLDIDHFKAFNDKWGHELGNKALIHISRLINLTVRKLDMACRFGGEEFIIILPNTDLQQAIQVAERLREALAKTPYETDLNEQITITASLGLDVFAMHNRDTAESFLQRADAWLYQAKNKGRNCVAHPEINNDRDAVAVTTEEKDALFGMHAGADRASE